MRGLGAGIGLLSLLIVVGLIFYMFAQSEIPKMKAGQQMKQQVRQISGYSQDETPATESFAASGVTKGSRLAALQVTSVTPGGAMDAYYGLRVNDEITAVGGTAIDAMANGDEEMAKSLVVSEGYQRKQPLTVRRNGQSFELPSAAAAAVPASPSAAPAPSAAASPAPQQAPEQPVAPTSPQRPKGLDRQLQGIRDAAGGGQGQE